MAEPSAFPQIIQGGMGVAVSDWRLANAVARTGQLGIVSGTGLDTAFVRRLQDGDPGGAMRRGMAQFPLHRTVDQALRDYFRPEGRKPGEPYEILPLFRQVTTRARQELTMLATFVEVFLAREGHGRPVGINLLTKIQLPTLPTLYGAMLAGAAYVVMGAGIPREIPGVLDRLAAHEKCSLQLDVNGLPPEACATVDFEPALHWESPPATLERPKFLPIVSSHSLATMLARKANGRVDGFVVEGPTAGGHNAPPRGEPRFNERGDPIYGKRDEIDLTKLRELGLPFWLAGGVASPRGLATAKGAGAAGVQVGTLFAFCDESGFAALLKQSVLMHASRGEVVIATNSRASPTGYPFKIADWPENPAARVTRKRVCDLGYLRVAFLRPDGTIGYRCAGEPESMYTLKGGKPEDTLGRQCLCNALLSAVGLPQTRADGFVEPPIITSGDDLANIGSFLDGRTRYSAKDVVDYLLSDGPETVHRTNSGSPSESEMLHPA